MEKVSIVLFTKELCEQLITQNTHNRAPSKKRISEYVGYMERNQWELSNDAICISLEGVILNGQHRLYACIKSGIPFRAIFLEDASPDMFKYIDRQLRRTTAQALTMGGFSIPNMPAVSAMINLLLTNSSKISPSPQDVEDYIREHQKDILIAMGYLASFNAGDIKPAVPALAGLYKIVEAVHPDKLVLDSFVSQIALGYSLTSKNPITAMRSAWKKGEIMQNTGTDARQQATIAIVQTWNYWVGSHELNKFKLTAKMPKIQPVIGRLWLKWMS